MSIFNRIVNALKGSKSNKEVTSHRLGSNNDSNTQNSSLTFSFKNKSLGFEVSLVDDCLVKVVKVVSGSEAQQNGVQIGDVIVSVDGNSVTTPDELAGLLEILNRPISLR